MTTTTGRANGHLKGLVNHSVSPAGHQPRCWGQTSLRHQKTRVMGEVKEWPGGSQRTAQENLFIPSGLPGGWKEATKMRPGRLLSTFHSLVRPQPLLLDSQRGIKIKNSFTEKRVPEAQRREATCPGSLSKSRADPRTKTASQPIRGVSLPNARPSSLASSSQGSNDEQSLKTPFYLPPKD